MPDLINFARDYLEDARAEGAIEEDASNRVIEREAQKLERLLYQAASSFVANEFDDDETH